MSLLGSGVVLVWCDLADATHDEHEAWHSYQHMPERLGVPGFLRARRGITTQQGAPRIFVLYELASLAVAASQPYLQRLDNPTAWTRRMMGSVHRLGRTPCRIVASHGSGIGTHVLTLRLSPHTDQASALQEWLVTQALPELVRRPGLVSVHLLARDDTTATNETNEQRLRGRPDELANWAVVVDGFDAGAVSGVRETISGERLAGFGATIDPASAQYHIVHVASVHDAVADRSFMERIYRAAH